MKLIKKLIAITCMATIAVSSLVGVTAFAASSAENPLELYLEDGGHDTEGLYTVNVKYKNNIEGMAVPKISLYIDVSDTSLAEEPSYTAVDAGAGCTPNLNKTKKQFMFSHTNTDGFALTTDVTKTEGTYYSIKFYAPEDKMDATGALTEQLSLTIATADITVGDMTYSSRSKTWKYDDLTTEKDISIGNGVVISGGTLTLGGSTPEPTDPWVAAEQVGSYTGDKGFPSDGEAVAYKAQLDLTSRNDYITWAAKFNGTGKGIVVNAPSADGEGKVYFGLIIGGLDGQTVSDVYAGWGELSTAPEAWEE